jgi:hypothetical protein
MRVFAAIVIMVGIGLTALDVAPSTDTDSHQGDRHSIDSSLSSNPTGISSPISPPIASLRQAVGKDCEGQSSAVAPAKAGVSPIVRPSTAAKAPQCEMPAGLEQSTMEDAHR